MMNDDNDILVQLSEEDYEELADVYRKHSDKLPHLQSFLQNCIKAKKTGLPDFVTIYSPNNCWRQDGTFIASMPTNGHDLVLHSLDPLGRNLTEGLAKTKKLKFLEDPARKYTLFYSVCETFSSNILEAMEAREEEILFAKSLNLWCLKKEEAIKFDMSDTEEVYFKAIEPEDVALIAEIWPNRYPACKAKLLDWVGLGAGWGLCLKSSHKLVCWVILSCLGQMAALETLPEYKKKGYGSLVVKKMARHLAEKGFDACATVDIDNVPSENLFRKLGFRNMYECQYIGVANKH